MPPDGRRFQFVAAPRPRLPTVAADTRQVTVAVHGNDVTLSGPVRHGAERETATNTAWGAPGVRNVLDRMTFVS